jgi:L-methionine (R)-S-oxide reductase
MSGNIDFEKTADLPKEEKYKTLIPQIISLVKGESNKIANLANVVSVLKYTFDYYLWVGFYFVDDKNKNELILGPFQGKIACTRLKIGKGVCGTSAEKKETILVKDVSKFSGHVACDTASKSEIVIPVIKNGIVEAVLDVDSGSLAAFDETDKKLLEELVKQITYIF